MFSPILLLLSPFISEKRISAGSERTDVCRIVSPSALLTEMVLSSLPKASRFCWLQAPHVIFFVCLAKIGIFLEKTKRYFFNSLAPGKFEWNFRYVIFKQILAIDGWGISCKIALIWMLLDFTDDQSTLVQVMAWCRQATSHYRSQCWPRTMSPNGVTRPQWVKIIIFLETMKR